MNKCAVAGIVRENEQPDIISRQYFANTPRIGQIFLGAYLANIADIRLKHLVLAGFWPLKIDSNSGDDSSPSLESSSQQKLKALRSRIKAIINDDESKTRSIPALVTN
jgi:hypothetical protein